MPESAELLALLGALFTAFSQVTAKQAVARVSPSVFLALRWPCSLLLFSLFLTMTDGWTAFRLVPELWLVVAGGLIGPVLAWSLYARAIKRLDVAVAYSIAQTQTLGSLLLAAIFLGEVPSLFALLGAVLILVGVVLINHPFGSTRASRLDTVGVLLVLGTASCWALTYVFWKIGVGALGVYEALWIRMAVPALVDPLVVAWRVRAGREPPLLQSLTWGGVLACAATGLFADLLSFGFQFAALRVGSVASVTPIVSSSPLFLVGLSTLLLGERVGRRALLGIAVIVLGVGLVAGLGGS